MPFVFHTLPYSARSPCCPHISSGRLTQILWKSLRSLLSTDCPPDNSCRRQGGTSRSGLMSVVMEPIYLPSSTYLLSTQSSTLVSDRVWTFCTMPPCGRGTRKHHVSSFLRSLLPRTIAFASLENKKAGLLIRSDRAGDSPSAGKKRQKKWPTTLKSKW